MANKIERRGSLREFCSWLAEENHRRWEDMLKVEDHSWEATTTIRLMMEFLESLFADNKYSKAAFAKLRKSVDAERDSAEELYHRLSMLKKKRTLKMMKRFGLRSLKEIIAAINKREHGELHP